MLAVLLLEAKAPQPFVSSEVEKPVTVPGFSTSLETNGEEGARTAFGQTALDAERAFAADAQTLGQWTAGVWTCDGKWPLPVIDDAVAHPK